MFSGKLTKNALMPRADHLMIPNTSDDFPPQFTAIILIYIIHV